MTRPRTALEHFQKAIAAGLSQGWILNATGEHSGVATDAEREGVLTTDDLEIPEAALVSRRTNGICVHDPALATKFPTGLKPDPARDIKLRPD